jgi:MEMO1 family protein
MNTAGSNASLVRKPVFAGRFYPATGNHLSKQLATLLATAKKPAATTLPQAIIAPHAGYIFSGQVAASAYNQLPDNAVYKRVFILATSHHFSYRGASVSNAKFYETPLGKIKVDADVVSKLLESKQLFHSHAEAHLHEHSLEVQLPFLQHKLAKGFLLVPLVLGTYDSSECKKIASILDPWFNPENLFVVSTDFSHYPAYDDAVENDLNTAQAICSNNPETLTATLSQDKNIDNLATSLCGSTSVLTLLYLTQNKSLKFFQVHYQNSGDALNFGERDRVVGYWAIAAYWNEEPLYISPHQQAEILAKVRKVIHRFIETGDLVHPKPLLQIGIKPAGMFVSIYIKGQLHGCIGNFETGSSWNETVEHLAVSACCDKRFEALKKEELDDMELEISVLSPLKLIHSIDEIELGKHGIYIKKGSHSGTFLPKVAKNKGWSVKEFLGYCTRDKAGLGWDEWKDAEIYIFEAFVFRG